MNPQNPSKPRLSLKQQLKQKLSVNLRTVIIIGSTSLGILVVALTIFFNLSDSKKAIADSNGDYRSKQNGNWSASSSWEKFNGSNWVNASSAPTSADGEITIRSGHTITLATNATVDQLTVSSGGTLTLNANLTLNNGAETDLVVSGTLNNSATLTGSASSSIVINGTYILNSGGNTTLNSSVTITINDGGLYRKDGGSQTTSVNHWIINSGGVYQHNMNGSTLPMGTWNTGSTCHITGVTNSIPSNLGQNFFHLIWNCPSQNQKRNLSSALTSVGGDFSLVSTGTESLQLSQSSNMILNVSGNFNLQGGTLYLTESGDPTINVTGNYLQTGGSLNMTDAASSTGSGNPVMNVDGNFSISSGTFNMSQYTGSNSNYGTGTLNLESDFSFTGGTITETATNAGKGQINFQKTGIQSVTDGGAISNLIHFSVAASSTLNLGSAVLSGSGNFTLAANAGIMIGSSMGITSSSTTGNVKVTGSRSYSSLANYTYNGTTAQATGNGLPSTVNNLTFDNEAGVTLSSSTITSGSLSLSKGIVTTNSNTLTLGTSASSTGTLNSLNGYVNGNFKRWIAHSAISGILFPVGSSSFNNTASISFVNAPSSGGTLTSSFSVADPGSLGLPVEDDSVMIPHTNGYGYWVITSGNGLNGGVYNIELTGNGFEGINDPASLRILYRSSGTNTWFLNGNHTDGAGTSSGPIGKRNEINGFGEFTFGGTNGNSLPITLVYFSVKNYEDYILTEWQTAAEINNDYFTIERSANGTDFEEIGTEDGAGNSTMLLNYSFNDDDPKSGMSYYRLKQTDYDGKFSYSDLVNVNRDLNAMEVVRFSPNPVHTFAEIELNQNATNASLLVYNISGQVVQQNTNLSGEIILFERNDLPSGTYIYVITMENVKLSGKFLIH